MNSSKKTADQILQLLLHATSDDQHSTGRYGNSEKSNTMVMSSLCIFYTQHIVKVSQLSKIKVKFIFKKKCFWHKTDSAEGVCLLLLKYYMKSALFLSMSNLK